MHRNKYASFSVRELKALKRVNKENPEALALINEALKPKYKKGSITAAEVATLHEFLGLLHIEEITKNLNLSEELRQLRTKTTETLRRFRLQTTPPPYPEKPLAPSEPSPEGSQEAPELEYPDPDLSELPNLSDLADPPTQSLQST